MFAATIFLEMLFIYSITISNTNSLDPTKELCDGTLDLKTFLFINKICEDCFSLFRDSDIYNACRSNCFSSSYFPLCMDSLLVDQDTKDKAGKVLVYVDIPSSTEQKLIFH